MSPCTIFEKSYQLSNVTNYLSFTFKLVCDKVTDLKSNLEYNTSLLVLINK